MRVALLGRTHWLLDAGQRAMRDGHQIVLVATAAAQREYRAKEDDFAKFAAGVSAPFHLSPDVNSETFRRALTDARADIAVSMNWPSLVRHETCAIPRDGILNAHAGDLPRYRGNACPNWAILNGEPHIGLCIHAMDPDEVDAGPVYVRRRLPLDETIYIGDVYRWMDTSVPEMFSEALEHLGCSDFAPEDQTKSGVVPLRCHPRRPEDGRVDWSAPAETIGRLVRASSRPLAGAFAFLDGQQKVTIWRARPASLDYEILAVPGQILGRSAAGNILVAGGSGVLEIEEAEISGGGPLPASNRHRLTSTKVES